MNRNTYFVLASTVLVCIILYVGRILFIPLFYGLFIAIVLYPFCRWLEKHRFSRNAAIAAGLLVITALFSLLLWLLVFQLQLFLNDWPELNDSLQAALVSAQDWLLYSLNISADMQSEWLTQAKSSLFETLTSLFSGVFDRLATSLFMLFIIPIFAALFLHKRRDFVLFLEAWAGKLYYSRVQKIIKATILTYFLFIRGMVLVYLIVGILNSIGFLLLDLRHAILFGFLTAIMTIIPYVGILISGLLPLSIAWITKDSIWYPIGVIFVLGFVQYLEANVIFPRVIGRQIEVSTWATLVAIIAGGILWGVSGMILFIPFLGILKIVTDYFPEWKPLNILLSR